LLAADRSYMLSMAEEDGDAPQIALDEFNFGLLPAVNQIHRLEIRFGGKARTLAAMTESVAKPLNTEQALELGLITFAPDELDWQDEVRIAIEERVSLSPDALTGMEASLRFPGPESMETKVFGRLSAWQNWVFIRPNSTGEHGALKLFGSGTKAKFSWERV
jgi:benzoyl-CoA-dihydrodiol lyase